MIVATAALCLMGQIELRGLETAPVSIVVGVNRQGVLLSENAASPASYLVGWDRVARVGGVHAPEAKAFEQAAIEAWRARTRLERGDAISAEPLFEKLFEDYAGDAGPLSVVVCEGLLRCRLRRGAQVGAMEPWMALLDSRRYSETGPLWVGEDWSSEAGLSPVIDEASGLVPALPPMALAWPALSGLATEGDASLRSGRAGALAALYSHAARFELGEPSTLASPTDQHWSVQLVYDIVLARTGDAAQRRQARDRLSRRITQGADPWVEAWCRAGIGRSLVKESSAEDRLLGVLELLHVPARFEESQAYLSGVALGECVIVLSELGDDSSAKVLARELAQRYRGHPVLDWAPVTMYLGRGIVRSDWHGDRGLALVEQGAP